MNRFIKYACLAVFLVIALAEASLGQPSSGKSSEAAKSAANPASSSPAFAELLLRKTEAVSELESLSLDYTDEFPKVKELRHVLSLVDRDMARISKVKAADTGKLTLALGKLLLRRIEVETDMWKLQGSYKDEHPEVKRAKRKVEIYDSAIAEILN